MVDMLHNSRQNHNLVKSWMMDYGLFQGINSQNRTAIVNQFLQFVQTLTFNTDNLTIEQIKNNFTELLTKLFQTVNRSWVSATSKLLWCLYPNTIAIYDTFVHRTLAVMQCLDDDLAGFSRIGEQPSIRSTNDIQGAVQHYMNYQAMVRKLLYTHSTLLQELRVQHQETYPYDVRILDKLLWMIGNFREMY